MTDLFSGFTIGTTPSIMDMYMVIELLSLGSFGLIVDGFGMPSNYVYTSSGCKLDTKEGKKLCEEWKLTWKYPKLGKVILLSPGCKGILQDMKALKVTRTRTTVHR